jgi:hypothetical protein
MKFNFWKWLGIWFGTAFILCAVGGAMLFVGVQARQADLAAVDDTYTPNKDPFEGPLQGGTSTSTSATLIDGYLYRDSLPLGFTNWSWDAEAVWQSTRHIYEGLYALQITFDKPDSNIGMNGPAVPIGGYHSLSIAVYPDSSVENLYLELYDAQGNSLGRQSLAWYAPDSVLKPNTWQVITLPLANLVGSSSAAVINGFGITGENPGVAYIDSVQLNTAVVAHSVWTPPPPPVDTPYDPLATSTPVALPYSLSLTQAALARWYTFYGTFKLFNGLLIAGPEPGGNTDAVSIFPGGKVWSDYAEQASLNWGEVSVFSLIVRFVDQKNYDSCAFSHDADTVQIYQVVNGVSTLIGQTPTLAVDYDTPWANVVVAAQVEEEHLSCIVGGRNVLSADIPSMRPTGTVGVESYDPNSYASPHTIHMFKVEELTGGE